MRKEELAEKPKAPEGRDQGFTFPLPTRVEGVNSQGKGFTEGTVLTYIDHEGSSFFIKNSVAIDARLKLIIDLPEKLAQDKTLKMIIKGKVTQIEADRDRLSRQKVTIKFDSKYIIKAET